MRKLFIETLQKGHNSAMDTELNAMKEWWVDGDPATDPAGIAGSVIAGLSTFAHICGVDPTQFIREDDLSPLADLTAHEIVLALDAIHKFWRADNWNTKRLVEKYFRGQLHQYHQTPAIGWDEVEKDLLFVIEYLKAAGSTVTKEEIKAAYENFPATDNDPTLTSMKDTASREFVTGFIYAIEEYAEANADKKPQLADAARRFLEKHNTDREALDTILAAI